MSRSPSTAGDKGMGWVFRSASGLVLSHALGATAHAQAAPTALSPDTAATAASEVIATAPTEGSGLAGTTSSAGLADAGYAALKAGDLTTAADRFTKALGRADLQPPIERGVVLALSDTLLQLKEPEHAAAVLSLVKTSPAADYAVASRLAFALDAAGKRPEAAVAYAAAVQIAPTSADRVLMLKGRAYDLAALGRGPDALAAARPLADAAELGATDAVNFAYVAVKFGDDRLALRFFDRADALQPLTSDTALDAAYCARRLGDDTRALRYFGKSLDGGARAGREAAQKRFQVRREIADLSRRVGGSVSVFYYNASSLAGQAPHSGRGDVQVGGEAFYRPFGFNAGRPVDLFARAFETVGSRRGDATGPRTLQGWIGARAKPFTDVNFILEASRLAKIGKASISDWEVRASYSTSGGMDLRADRSRWPMWNVYADAARLLETEENFALVDARVGQTFRLGASRLMVAPFVGAYASYDSALSPKMATGLGPGVWFRQWLREATGVAPRSSVDVALQYRVRLGGDRRAAGFFLTFSAAY